MAKQGAKGAGRVVRNASGSSAHNPKRELLVRRDTTTGRFVQVKKSGGSFKGVKRER